MRFFRTLPLFLFLLTLTACSGRWLGASDTSKIAGDRISVLTHENSLAADIDATDLAVLLPRPEALSSWPQAGGFSHHAMHHLRLSGSVERLWKRNIGEGSNGRHRLLSQPVAAKGTIYTLDAKATLTAVDLKTGKKSWQLPLLPETEEDGALFGGGIAYNRGRIFVSTGFARLFSVSAEDGRILWFKDMPAPMRAAPTVSGGRLFITTLDNTLHALAASDGRVLWSHDAAPEVTALLGAAEPAADAGAVVTAFSSGELKALRTDSGSLLWSEMLTGTRQADAVLNVQDIKARPAIDRGRVYAVGHGGVTIALDLKTGMRIWEQDLGGITQPWIAGKYLYMMTNTAELVCLEKSTGSIQWVRSLPRFEDEEDKIGRLVWTGPVLASDRLIVAGSHGAAVVISPYTGEVLATDKLSGGVSLPPILVDDTLIFLTDDADLIAYK